MKGDLKVASRRRVLANRERSVEMLQMRIRGKTWQAIADHYGMKRESTPKRAVDRLLERQEYEGAAEMRRLEGLRLEALHEKLWETLLIANPRQRADLGNAIVRIAERRAKMFGIDAPTQLLVGSGSVMNFHESANDLVSRIAANQAAMTVGQTELTSALVPALEAMTTPELEFTPELEAVPVDP